MLEELIPKKGETTEKFFDLVVKVLDKGMNKRKIVKAFVRQGWSEAKAIQFIDDTERETEKGDRFIF